VPRVHASLKTPVRQCMHFICPIYGTAVAETDICALLSLRTPILAYLRIQHCYPYITAATCSYATHQYCCSAASAMHKFVSMCGLHHSRRQARVAMRETHHSRREPAGHPSQTRMTSRFESGVMYFERHAPEQEGTPFLPNLCKLHSATWHCMSPTHSSFTLA
jgi:hypothetical protein